MTSPNIQFDAIPTSIRKPGKYIEFNTRMAIRTLPGNPQSIVILAQCLGTKNKDATRIFDAEDAGRLFGYGSQAHRMALAAMQAHPYIDLTIMPMLDPEEGIAATGSISAEGSATASGVVTLYIGSDQLSLLVEEKTTAEAMLVALAQKIQEQESLPVRSAITEEGILMLTAKNKGLYGNSIFCAVEHGVPGVEISVVPFSGGVGVPDVGGALSKIFMGTYTLYCIDAMDQDSLMKLKEHLDTIGSPLEQRGALGVYAYTKHFDDALTLAGVLNSPRITGCFLQGTRSLSCEVAAAYAAVIASEEDPARPLNSLVLKGIFPPPMEHFLSRRQQEVALNNGVTPLEVEAGSGVSIVRAISTYTKNSSGALDSALLDITTMRTLDYVRTAVRERIQLRFPREKLSIRVIQKVRSEILDVLRKMEELQILEYVNETADGVIVERDKQDTNRLNARIPADVVNGLHIFAGQIDLVL